MSWRWRGLLAAGWMRDLRGRRAGSVVLISALLGAVFVASVGVGYTASRPLNDTGGAVLAKGDTVAYVNGESGRMEAEARSLASGKNDLETVTLRDGRVAVVDRTAQRVWIVNTAMMTPQGAPIDRGAGDLTVVAGPRHSYLVDAAAGTVEEIDPKGALRAPVRVPGGATTTAVPDGSDGVWVLTADGMVVRIRDGRVERRVDSGGRVEHLTLADRRPIAISDSGELLDVSADPLRRVSGERVPHGPNVVVGSPEGAGRWILVVDRRAGELIVVDPRTGTRRVFSDLPSGPRHNLGAPVVVRDTVYVPDHALHLIYVRNIATGEVLADIPVPGRSPTISLEVHGEKVWANDQHDRRAVVIGLDGSHIVVDKGTGEGLTDTTAPQDVTEPDVADPEPVTAPEPVPGPPLPGPPLPGPPLPGPAGPDEGEPAAAPEQVRVPGIRAGTDKDDACQRILDAGLLCAVVAAGNDGPANEVIGTDPPGGSMVPPGYRVTVRHYGPRTVPDVVGRFTTDACRAIEASGLRCASEPNPGVAASPDELDVVAAQDPAGGDSVSRESTVNVRYSNRAVLGDYRNRPGAQACADIEATYRRVDCTVAEGQTEQQTGQAAGTGYTQSPAPGAAITMGQTVTIIVVKGSPRVPDVGGLSKDQACQTLDDAGYGCDARADAIARNAVVTTQDTAPGTPMDSGTVVIHYAPYEPVAFRLYQSDTGEPVFLVRMDGNPDQNYSTPYGGILGYGYAQQWEQPGSWMIWDHYCTSNKTTCLGWSTNHYQSRSNQRFHDNWQGPQESARFVAPAGPEQCAAGQVPMYRFADFRKSQGAHDDIVGSSAP
ncbi:MAG: PASTA domain-containing protein, partial [Pseudonocardiaceae bacterium]